MRQAPGYGSIYSPAAKEEATDAVRPTLPESDDRLVDLYNRRVGPPWRSLASRAALALGAAAAVLGLAYTAQPSSRSGSPSLVEVNPSASATTPAAAAQQELAPLSFEALNFYHVRDGKPGQDYKWLKDVKLIEPFRETTLSISSPRDGHDYIWEVRGLGEDEVDLRATARGAEATVILTELEENTITVTEVDAAGAAVRQLEETVMVKYVRREIRTLTDDEREELFDAMHQLWVAKVDGGNGKKLYGDDYADIWAINRLHFKAAMNRTCDHFHDGLGFLTTHSLVSNTFEFSLQLVNPKLTLPYWDWTIEEVDAEMASVDGEIDIKSPLFTADWFGSADPDDWVVKDSRWAYTEIPSMYEGNPGGDLVPDVYGHLRSRWNANDSPYVMRGLGQYCDAKVVDDTPWPSCSTHLSLVTDYPTWYGWVCESAHTPHGNVHIWIGGMLNCDETIGNLSELVGKDNADLLKANAMNRKGYWREEMYQCEGFAEEDMPLEEVYSTGKCGCLGYDLSEESDDWQTIYYNSTGEFDSIIGEYDEDTKRRVVAEICRSTIFNGEHLHAGSSPDPSFWPMHPTMERLWMYSVMTGHITDMTWPDSTETSDYGDISSFDDSCVGHGGSDVFPFGILDTDVDGFEIKTGIRGNLKTGNVLNNREVLAAMNVDLNMLPYVYDTFKWDHCLEVGVDFNDAWETGSSAADETEKSL